MKLTSKLIKQLDGKLIRLTSENANGKLLSVDSGGLISLEEPNSSEAYDQYWSLVPVQDGFLIRSSVDSFIICYDPFNNKVKVVDQVNDDNCSWKVGVGGEFYQANSNGGEIYLWIANGKMYATFDGYLAENWIPLDIGNVLPGIYTEKYGNSSNTFMMVILVVISVLLFYLVWNKNR
uniref:Uncharacterized protein n=1 Tax=Marseillevirus LCMAC101 TaxID=2506602 RepID=A0A481YS84_9VIRU|nr:MAG: hypothetical protein LCMAC101_02000 [Marseillevirus LCMAC101]